MASLQVSGIRAAVRHTPLRRPSMASPRSVEAAAAIKLYQNESYGGQCVEVKGNDTFLENFNDKCSSAVVESGEWELFQHASYEGAKTVLKPGKYRNSTEMGLSDSSLSSLRFIPGSDVGWQGYWTQYRST